MALPTYQTGTVSVPEHGTVVSGSGTIWSGLNVVAGDLISIDGEPATIIIDVAGVAELAIPEWRGEAKSDVSYVIYQVSSLRFSDVQIALDLKKQVQALNTEGFYVFVPPSATEPDPSLGDDGQYARQPQTGKEWHKEGGVWIFDGIFRATSTKGAWDPETEYKPGDIVSRGGRLWICVQMSTDDPPESSPDYWQLYLAGGDRYDLASFDTDRPGTGELLVKIYPLGVTFPVGLAESQAGAEVEAEAEAVFSITKNGIEFATLTFATGSAIGVFACASDTSFGDGDVLRVIAPIPRDATLSGVAATLVGYR